MYMYVAIATQIISYICIYSLHDNTEHTVYYKLFEVEKFCDFRRLIGNHEIFPVKYLGCTGFGHTRLQSNHECFPVNYSSGLHTANLFHLERFALYGNCLTGTALYNHYSCNY